MLIRRAWLESWFDNCRRILIVIGGAVAAGMAIAQRADCVHGAQIIITITNTTRVATIRRGCTIGIGNGEMLMAVGESAHDAVRRRGGIVIIGTCSCGTALFRFRIEESHFHAFIYL